jgi:uncharacterized protein
VGERNLLALHGPVATNSVKAVRKPRQRSRRVRPLAPITVETIRTSLGLRDATAAEAIRRAREEVLGPNVRSLYARTSKAEVPAPGIGSMTESRRPDSNRRHPLYERGALPTELRRRGSEFNPASTSLPVEIVVARTRRRRLLGLAFRDRPPHGWALLFPRCRSLHTFGMRFAIDVVFLDAGGRVVRVVSGLRPGRIVVCRRAAAAVEVRAGGGGIIAAMAEGQRNRFAEALDPRVPIYRDTYNEYFVFLLSAGGAIAGTQVPLYIVMAITGLWGLIPFVAGCVVFELAVIFGLARPQMKPQERVAWAGGWAVVTALLATAFYYLVAEPTL